MLIELPLVRIKEQVDLATSLFGTPPIYSILKVIGGGKDPLPERIDRGMYKIPHFSMKEFIPCEKGKTINEWPELDNYNLESFGVCDSPSQMMDMYREALEVEGRNFVVSFTKVEKKEQSPKDGWRWHKWGTYIGKREITTEYLYDEPEIDEVWVFNVFEVNVLV